MEIYIYKKCKVLYNDCVNGGESVSLRNKLKDSQMRLVELSTYMDISRPTLYKYLEAYELKDYHSIEKKCLDLFSFIDNSKNPTRPIIMDYLIHKVLPVETIPGSSPEILSNVRKMSESPKELDQKKMKIIELLSSSTLLDENVDSILELQYHKKG